MVELVERYLIVKRGLYFRPNNCGYTGCKSKAGRYPASRASADCGETAIHEDDAPEFSPACWPETKLAERDARIAALEAENFMLAAGVCINPGIHGLVGDEGGNPVCTAYQALQAEERAHSDALARIAALEAENARLREPVNLCETPEVAAMRYIEQLRADEGDSVTILCDDPEADSRDKRLAVECCGAWTDWRELRFYGESVLQCLAKAITARTTLQTEQNR